MTKKKTKGQGRISAWLTLYGSNLDELAEHLNISYSRCSLLCNSETVPSHIREGLESFRIDDGSSIPSELLPEGVMRKRGAKKGWLERKMEQVRQETRREVKAGL